MFFAPITGALFASVFGFASAVIAPDGFTSVTATNLSSLAGAVKFVITSAQFGTQLNVGYNQTGNGAAVILSEASTNPEPSQQWYLNPVGNGFTIQSVWSQTFLSFPGGSGGATSFNGQTIIDGTRYPTFLFNLIGQNAYIINETTWGTTLTAWPQYTEGNSTGLATFQVSRDLGTAQIWLLSTAPA